MPLPKVDADFYKAQQEDSAPDAQYQNSDDSNTDGPWGLSLLHMQQPEPRPARRLLAASLSGTTLKSRGHAGLEILGATLALGRRMRTLSSEGVVSVGSGQLVGGETGRRRALEAQLSEGAQWGQLSLLEAQLQSQDSSIGTCSTSHIFHIVLTEPTLAWPT